MVNVGFDTNFMVQRAKLDDVQDRNRVRNWRIWWLRTFYNALNFGRSHILLVMDNTGTDSSFER